MCIRDRSFLGGRLGILGNGNGQTERRIGIQLGLFLLTLEVFNTSAALGDFADLLSHSDDCYDIY